jgi:predicted DNA-binding protein (UPF0251 family)/predicted Fe-Mo cluster-binding NifX family protein
MPRPKLCRKVAERPKVTYFKPRGVPLRGLGETRLSVEGLEALRLADLESLTACEAALRMGVSRHTFGRILGQARRAVAEALVKAQALRIEGGEYSLSGVGEAADQAEKWTVSPRVAAVSAQGSELSDRMEANFGRAPGFVLVDLDTMATRYLDNSRSQAMAHGAGVQAAQSVAEAGAGVLLSGRIGAKAFKALAAAGVKVCLDLADLSVGQAVELYQAGGAPLAQGPNKL